MRLDAVSQRIDSLRPRVDPLERAHGYRGLNREFHGLIHEMARSMVVAEMPDRLSTTMNGEMWTRLPTAFEISASATNGHAWR